MDFQRKILNSGSDPPPDPTLSTTPGERADIASAFFLDGRVPEATYRGVQAFNRLIPNPEGLGQSVFQDLSFGLECFLSRRRNRNIPHLGKNQAEPLQGVPGRVTGFALTL